MDRFICLCAKHLDIHDCGSSTLNQKSEPHDWYMQVPSIFVEQDLLENSNGIQIANLKTIWIKPIAKTLDVVIE